MKKGARIDVRLSAAENQRFERRRKAAPQGFNRAKYARSLLLADRLIPAEHLVNEMRELRLALAHQIPQSVTARVEELYCAALDAVIKK